MARNVGDIIPIGTDGQFRLICTYSGRRKSKWLVQQFINHKFLWWKWSGWETFEYALGYGIAGYSYGHTETYWLDHDECNDELIWNAEYSLEFLDIELK